MQAEEFSRPRHLYLAEPFGNIRGHLIFIILTVLFACTDVLINTCLCVASTSWLAGQQLVVLSMHERELVTYLLCSGRTSNGTSEALGKLSLLL